MMFFILKDNFTDQQSQCVVTIPRYHSVFVKLFSELRLLSWTIYVISANMAVSLAQFLSSLQNEEKWIKGGKIITSTGLLRAVS